VTRDGTVVNPDVYTCRFALAMTESSQVVAARRLATQLATELGFDDTDTGKVALVATEVATNLVKHAVHGQLLIRQRLGATENGIELLALDKGPGMQNVAACLQDGYSTAGSLGTGLGAITRLASFWDIYSTPGPGTALLIRVSQTAPYPAVPKEASQALSVGVGGVCLPKAGEPVSGDAWGVVQQADRCLVMVSDGLGHGLLAADASWEAQRILQAHASYGPVRLLEVMHAALRKTRGAAVAIAELDARQQHVVFAGVGNIAGQIILAHKTHHLISFNGIVGHHMRRIQAFTYPWLADALLILASDGLLTRWNLDAYPGLNVHDPSLIAGLLVRDFARGRDDVTVTVAKAAPVV